jgi:hypothetical protein
MWNNKNNNNIEEKTQIETKTKPNYKLKLNPTTN